MRRLPVIENEKVPIGAASGVSPAEAARLRRFDELRADRAGTTVFDWSRASFLVARDYVGVVQVPGLLVEILPKTDAQASSRRTQKNFLYMLEVAGLIRARSRSLALLRHEEFTLLDAFLLVFADGLIDVLREGVDRGYVTTEDNLRVVRGRLLVHEQVRRNSVQRQNVYVRYDEFSPDTNLNRVLKLACRVLIRQAGSFEVTRRLREILDRLDEVRDVDFARVEPNVHLNRQNSRFGPFLGFARMVLEGRSPSPVAGDDRTFSLLFPIAQKFLVVFGGSIRLWGVHASAECGRESVSKLRGSTF